MRKHFPDIPGPNADTDTERDADTDTDANADTNPHADANPNADSGRQQRDNYR